MKKILTLGLSSVLAMSVMACSKPAVAQTAYALPIDVTLGYANNNVLEKDGLRAELGTEVRGVRLGLTSLTSEDRMETYGVYGAVPFQVHDTKLSIVPRIEAERYREIDETFGSLGIGAEYQMTPTIRADAVYKYSKAFDSDVDLDGNSFLFGVTKTF